MEHRVGIARPLVGGHELLCLHDEFSAHDLLTADSLRSACYRLGARGDRTSLFALASRLRLELGLAILAVKAAEVLDLAETPRQEVLLTPPGRAFVAADPNERKRLFHRQLRAIPTFAYLADMLRRAPG